MLVLANRVCVLLFHVGVLLEAHRSPADRPETLLPLVVASRDRNRRQEALTPGERSKLMPEETENDWRRRGKPVLSAKAWS